MSEKTVRNSNVFQGHDFVIQDLEILDSKRKIMKFIDPLSKRLIIHYQLDRSLVGVDCIGEPISTVEMYDELQRDFVRCGDVIKDKPMLYGRKQSMSLNVLPYLFEYHLLPYLPKGLCHIDEYSMRKIDYISGSGRLTSNSYILFYIQKRFLGLWYGRNKYMYNWLKAIMLPGIFVELRAVENKVKSIRELRRA